VKVKKSRELLGLASQLAEFGDAGTIEKIKQIAKTVRIKQLPSDEDERIEFLKMLGLYFYQIDILGGGEAAKKRLRDFTASWLNVKCSKGQEPVWEDTVLRVLSLEELVYVLGWAGRVAREKGSAATGGGTTPVRKPEKASIRDVPQDSRVNMTLEEQLKALKDKFSKK
jgi:hypothetical protein